MKNLIIRTALVLASALAAVLPAGPPAAADDFSEEREELVRRLKREFKAFKPAGKDGMTQRVREALLAVRRHEFVADDLKSRAYENRPLPIGYGQTISQPFIVALMTDMLELRPEHKVLEVGTGSGYQAAVLARIAERVFTIEIIPELAEQAESRLDRLGYDHVTVIHGDGYYGLSKQAPFDAIIVTAAAGHIPPPLISQLAKGGRMVIPVGEPFMTQQLMYVEKNSRGEVSTRSVLPVSFVPLTGGH
jgi:protein-L-isoaspartate(D-aspartate) O-methyltransferase